MLLTFILDRIFFSVAFFSSVAVMKMTAEQINVVKGAIHVRQNNSRDEVEEQEKLNSGDFVINLWHPKIFCG